MSSTTVESPTAIRPFEVHVSQEVLDDLRRRLAETRWPEKETVADRITGGAARDDPGGVDAKLIWRTASPEWSFDEAAFDRSAASFDNPDHVAIAIHNYRWRLGLAEGEAEYDELEKRLAEGPVIAVPAMTLEGDANGAPHPSRAPMPGSSRGRTPTARSRADRTQPPPRGSGSLCPGRHRRRRSLTENADAGCRPAHRRTRPRRLGDASSWSLLERLLAPKVRHPIGPHGPRLAT